MQAFFNNDFKVNFTLPAPSFNIPCSPFRRMPKFHFNDTVIIMPRTGHYSLQCNKRMSLVMSLKGTAALKPQVSNNSINVIKHAID